jgi:hypothetical protein
MSVTPANGDPGAVFTLTATVTALNSTAKPTGTVTFYGNRGDNGSQVDGTATIDPNTGTAVIQIHPDMSGFENAVYGGDANFSRSNTVDNAYYTVNTPPAPTFEFWPYAWPNPATADETILIDVGYLDESGATVCEGSTVLGENVTLPDNYHTWVFIGPLSVGTHYITAGGGCPTAPGESDVLTLVVLPAPTTVSDPPSTSNGDIETTPAAAVKSADPPAVKSVHAATTSTSASKAAFADPTTTDPGPALASTGVSVGPPIAAALTAFAVGTLLLLIGRRRERTTRGH